MSTEFFRMALSLLTLAAPKLVILPWKSYGFMQEEATSFLGLSYAVVSGSHCALLHTSQVEDPRCAATRLVEMIKALESNPNRLSSIELMNATGGAVRSLGDQDFLIACVGLPELANHAIAARVQQLVGGIREEVYWRLRYRDHVFALCAKDGLSERQNGDMMDHINLILDEHLDL